MPIFHNKILLRYKQTNKLNEFVSSKEKAGKHICGVTMLE
jgi:hypothetical protein